MNHICIRASNFADSRTIFTDSLKDNEKTIIGYLLSGYNVEVFYKVSDKPVANKRLEIVFTDSDGFCGFINRKLLIFVPGKNWSYCGGVIACIAEDVEEAEKIYNKEFTTKSYDSYQRFYKEEPSIKDTKYGLGTDTWVFLEEFTIPFGAKPRVVVSNYNYG